VTWFVPDVLGGFALDVANKTLYLAPALEPAGDATVHVALPMYFPAFWATVEAMSNGSGGGTLVLKVTKSFGTAVVVDSIVAQPIGRASAEGKRVVLNQSFSCTAGAVLQLDEHWAALVNPKLMERVLPSTPPSREAD
jgi:hypothetical protein